MLDQWIIKSRILTSEERQTLAIAGIDKNSDIWIEQSCFQWKNNEIIQKAFDPEFEGGRIPIQKEEFKNLKETLEKAIEENRKGADNSYKTGNLEELNATLRIIDEIINRNDFDTFNYFYESC